MRKEKQIILEQEISTILIEFAEFYRENFDYITSGDMEGISEASAINIIKIIKEEG